jgi:hypothetical protein
MSHANATTVSATTFRSLIFSSSSAIIIQEVVYPLLPWDYHGPWLPQNILFNKISIDSDLILGEFYEVIDGYGARNGPYSQENRSEDSASEYPREFLANRKVLEKCFPNTEKSLIFLNSPKSLG